MPSPHPFFRTAAASVVALCLTIGLALTSGASEAATGFAVKDLRRVEQDARSVGGRNFDTRASADRLTLTCTDCEGVVAIDVLLGRSTDGTEERFRSGETSIQRMESLCRARDDACRLERLDVGPAVGWLSIYSRGATAILFRGGDMLTIRAIGGTPQMAQTQVRAVLEAIGRRIVGR